MEDANKKSGLQQYQNKKWGFSFFYPSDWIIVSQNTDSGSWKVPINVGNKDGTGGPADFIVAVKKEEVLQAFGDNPNITITNYYDDGTTDTFEKPTTPTEYLERMKEENDINKGDILSEEENDIDGYPAIEYTFYEPTSGKTVISRVITVFGKGVTFQIKCQTPSKEFKKFNPIFSDILKTFSVTVKTQSNKKVSKKSNDQKNREDTSSKNKCPKCGYIMDEPDWRCPECYYEFEEDVENKSSSEEMSSNDTTSKKAKKPTSWGASVAAGAFGGAIAGLIASHGSGKLGFGAFIVFFLTMMGVNGGSRKALAGLIFAASAALVVVIFKQ